MQFYQIPGDPLLIMWTNEEGSGYARPGDPEWDIYQAQLQAGEDIPYQSEPPMTLPIALDMVLAEFERVATTLRCGYSQSEVDNWPLLHSEALAWQANAHHATPLVDAVLLPYDDKATFCASIIARFTAYATQMGELIMWRRIAEAAMEVYFASGRTIHKVFIQYPEVPSAS